MESAGNVVAADGTGTGNSAPAARPVAKRPRRTYHDLVTADAEPGEELVYGDAATVASVQVLYGAMVDRFGLWRK